MKKRSVRLLLAVLCLVAASSIKSPATVSASSLCGSCSLSACRGATPGRACTTLAGAPGSCQITGKLCGDHSSFCGCY